MFRAFVAGRKVLPQNFTRFSRRKFLISNRTPNQISPKKPAALRISDFNYRYRRRCYFRELKSLALPLFPEIPGGKEILHADLTLPLPLPLPVFVPENLL